VTNEAKNSGLTPEEIQLAMRLESIFMPHSRKQRDEAHARAPVKGYLRFAHYTSAEAGLNIIRSKRIWLRNTNCMADYREVEHGNAILSEFFSVQANKDAFVSALEACVPGAFLDGATLFAHSWTKIRSSSYIVSVSEHDIKEDKHGRLSMWRAFGGHAAARVAVVFSIPWLSVGGLALNLLFSPVAYLDKKEAHAEFLGVISNIRANAEFLRSVDRAMVATWVANMLLAGVTCLKHEGFHEEREWRGIYGPEQNPSTLMEHSTEIIAGVPQPVYKVPLDETVSPALADLEFSKIFDRLIIGPSPYPWAMYDAFAEALTKGGVPAAGERIFVSEIPIRS
jgi:hypothetical protein